VQNKRGAISFFSSSSSHLNTRASYCIITPPASAAAINRNTQNKGSELRKVFLFFSYSYAKTLGAAALLTGSFLMNYSRVSVTNLLHTLAELLLLSYCRRQFT